jgi:hypothetical protein
MLRERDPVGQVLWRRVRTQAPLVILPERFDLGAEVIVFGDGLGVCVATDDTSRGLVRRAAHAPPMCRDGAYGIL